MSSSEAELTLILRARDLATKTVDGFGSSVGKIGQAAEGASRRVGAAFTSLHAGITNGLGNLVENLSSGAGLGDSMLAFGAYMAGQAAEGLVGTLLERMAGSTLVAAIGGPLAAAGSALGGVVAAAIPIGMAALPFLLVGALVAAIAFLVTHPEVAGKILEVAGGIVSGIVNGLASLAGAILGVFVDAFGGVIRAVGGFVVDLVSWFFSIPTRLAELGASIVRTIVGGLVSLPGKVADVVRDAFANLKIDIGPFHIRSTGVTIDLPKIDVDAGRNSINGLYGGGQGIPGMATGGWAGLHGPQLTWLGESGPEYVRKAGTGTGDGGGATGVVLEGVSEHELLDMVERGLYFRLRRSAPTATPS